MSTIKVTNLRHESATSNNITLDSSARVGIGTTSPSNLLHLNGTAPAIRFSDTQANGSAFSIIEDNDGLLRLRNDAGNAGTGSGIAFTVDGAEEARILAGGGLTFNGDTAAANALDDYEEGSWTPTMSGATLSGETGTYTRIGRFVHAHFYCPVSSHDNNTTVVVISGLPFSGAERSVGASIIVRNGIDHTIQLLATYNGSSFTSIKFAKTVNDGNSSDLKLNDCNTSFHLAGAIQYHVA